MKTRGISDGVGVKYRRWWKEFDKLKWNADPDSYRDGFDGSASGRTGFAWIFLMKFFNTVRCTRKISHLRECNYHNIGCFMKVLFCQLFDYDFFIK